ncbi:MAG: hypothetical protein SFV51_04485, partial [Bryobacteraceae bacterium]|nr:hypothetical protein [Bryobacteraceae bacterium]
MDLRYIEYAGGNFSSYETSRRPAAPLERVEDSAARPAVNGKAAPAVPPPSMVAEQPVIAPHAAEPVPAAAPALVAATPVPNNFDLVSVDDVHFDADQPEGPPVDVRDLFTSGEIPGAIVVADGALPANGVARTVPAPAAAAHVPPAAPAP